MKALFSYLTARDHRDDGKALVGGAVGLAIVLPIWAAIFRAVF